MSTVGEMIDDILRREGGYVDHPSDRGGPTKYGITQATLSEYKGRPVSFQEVAQLEEPVAREIYASRYFLGPGIDQLPDSIQPFIFDCSINHGPRRAIKFVQSVCNQARYNPPLEEDGAMGPKTREAAKWAAILMGPVFYRALLEERRNFYRAIVTSDPSQNVFLKGWMNRVDEFVEEAE